MPETINSNRRRGILRTRSVRICLPSATMRETLATESCVSPDSALGTSPFQVAGERYAECGTDAASIDSVTLDHDYRPSVSRLGPGGLFQISPPDFSLFDYHSTRRRNRWAARLAKGSDSKPTAAIAWFIISVTRSVE
jgi:hypothetical protein